METLPGLRFCAETIAQRESSDREHRWQWTIRKKVLEWTIAVLERQNENDLPTGELTVGEKQTLLATHPLLRPAANAPICVFQPDAQLRHAVQSRVQAFVGKLGARRKAEHDVTFAETDSPAATRQIG